MRKNQFALLPLALLLLFLFTGCAQSVGKSSRIKIANEYESGERLEINGTVVNESGFPIKGVELFFYQANSNGEYESTFFGMPSFARLRGKAYTDENGNFQLASIIPGNYPGESDGKHIHAIAKAKGYKEWRFEFLFEGWVTESLRNEIAKNNDGIILDPKQDTTGIWQVSTLIQLVKKEQLHLSN